MLTEISLHHLQFMQPKTLMNSGPDRSSFQCSHNSWINDKAFALWFINVFLVEIQSVARPILPVSDGHQYHFAVQVIGAAKQNNIIILCLPRHCKHGLRRLDLVTFG